MMRPTDDQATMLGLIAILVFCLAGTVLAFAGLVLFVL